MCYSHSRVGAAHGELTLYRRAKIVGIGEAIERRVFLRGQFRMAEVVVETGPCGSGSGSRFHDVGTVDIAVGADRHGGFTGVGVGTAVPGGGDVHVRGGLNTRWVRGGARRGLTRGLSLGAETLGDETQLGPGALLPGDLRLGVSHAAGAGNTGTAAWATWGWLRRRDVQEAARATNAVWSHR